MCRKGNGFRLYLCYQLCLLFGKDAHTLDLAVLHHLVELSYILGLFGIGCLVVLGLLGCILIVTGYGLAGGDISSVLVDIYLVDGADGLKEKINRAIEGKKVGYTEMLSRYGDSYSKVTPDDAQEREKFLKAQAAIVAKINAPDGADIAKIVHSTGGGLRRVYTEIEKLRRMQA